jgi:hypothetical protein
MSLKMWEGTVEHAQTCPVGSIQYAYQPHNGLSIIFNNIFQLVAIKDQTGLRAADSLNLKDKAIPESWEPTSTYRIRHRMLLSHMQLRLPSLFQINIAT